MSVRVPSVRLLAIAILVIAATTLPVASAGAAPKPPASGKSFVMNVKTPVPAGVTDTAYTITLQNTTGTQQLGSANITVPGQFVASAPVLDAATVARGGTAAMNGGVLELRSLALPPGSELVTVTLTLRVSCVADGYPWPVVAKQSNDFSGTGNLLGPVSGTMTTAVTGFCRLRFIDAKPAAPPEPEVLSGQPAGTEVGFPVRAKAFTPTSDQLVSVEAIDGGAGNRLSWFGDPVRVATDHGNVSSSVNATAGVARFSALIINATGNYTLEATTSAAGFAVDADGVSDRSDPFQVIEVVEGCDNAGCSAQSPQGAAGRATLTGSLIAGTGFALMTTGLGNDPIDSTGCAEYTPPAGSDHYEFLLFGVTGVKTIVVEYTKGAMKRRSPSSLEICWAAPDVFTAKDGLDAPAFDYDGDEDNGDEGFAGLLPDCPLDPPGPCVSDRSPLPGGGATITATDPSAGDPRLH